MTDPVDRRRGGDSPGAGQGGFTIIELMVVIILIGTAFTYGLLNIDHLVPKARLDKAARDVGEMLTRLRGMAVFGGRSHFLEYDLDDQRYRLLRPTTDAEQDEGAPEMLESEWFELPRRIRIKSIQFTENDTETRGLIRAEFTPTGEVVGHLVHFIADDISDRDGQNLFTVELNPITGLVSYVPGIHKEYNQVRNEFEFR